MEKKNIALVLIELMVLITMIIGSSGKSDKSEKSSTQCDVSSEKCVFISVFLACLFDSF